MTAKNIDDCLRAHFSNNSRYMVSNVYAFDNFYKETDFLIVKENGYIYDIEIKVSKSDFKADFKKLKHEILKNGFIVSDKFFARTENEGLQKYYKGDKIYIKRPNRFYFCVPENLITKDDIPDYAGLLYITESGRVIKIKEAKLLHKDNRLKEIESILCRKFYFSYLDIKTNKNKELEEELSLLREEVGYLRRKNDLNV